MTEIKTTARVNFRREPVVRPDTVLAVLSANTSVEATGREIGDWLEVDYSMKVRGYIHRAYTTAGLPPPPVPPPTARSRGNRLFGWHHVSFGAYHDLRDYLERARAAKVKVGPVAVVEEVKAIIELDAAGLLDDASVVCFRRWVEGDQGPHEYQGREWTPEEWFGMFKDSLSVKRPSGKPLLVSAINERMRKKNLAFYNKFYTGWARIMKAHNLIGCVGEWSVGAVDKEDIPAMLPMLREAAALGQWICGNTYYMVTHPDPEIGRLSHTESMRLLQYMIPIMEAVPEGKFFTREFGYSDNNAQYPGREPWRQLLDWHVQLFIQANYYGASQWGFNPPGGGWPQSHVPSQDRDLSLAVSEPLG